MESRNSVPTIEQWGKIKRDLIDLDEALSILAPMLGDDALRNPDPVAHSRVAAIHILASLASEARRLHDGEAIDIAYEGEVPSPAQWLSFFNRQSTDRRMKILERVIESGEMAGTCYRNDHEGSIANLREDLDRLRKEKQQQKDTTVETIMIDGIKNYGKRLMDSDLPVKRDIGEEILKTIGAR